MNNPTPDDPEFYALRPAFPLPMDMAEMWELYDEMVTLACETDKDWDIASELEYTLTELDNYELFGGPTS